jgi:hypothetical protein
MRIGMEIDVWFKPTRLETVIAECKAWQLKTFW